MTVDILKAENDQLKTGGSRPPSSASQSSGLGSLGTSSPRQSVASLSKTFSMGATESLNTGEDICMPLDFFPAVTQNRGNSACVSVGHGFLIYWLMPHGAASIVLPYSSQFWSLAWATVCVDIQVLNILFMFFPCFMGFADFLSPLKTIKGGLSGAEPHSSWICITHLSFLIDCRFTTKQIINRHKNNSMQFSSIIYKKKLQINGGGFFSRQMYFKVLPRPCRRMRAWSKCSCAYPTSKSLMKYVLLLHSVHTVHSSLYFFSSHNVQRCSLQSLHN